MALVFIFKMFHEWFNFLILFYGGGNSNSKNKIKSKSVDDSKNNIKNYG